MSSRPAGVGAPPGSGRTARVPPSPRRTFVLDGRRCGEVYFAQRKKKLNLTCGNCQLLCVADREERKRRFKMLTTSGVAVRNPDGALDVVSPEVGRQRAEALPSEKRALCVDG